MKTWDEVIKDALSIHLHKDKYAYFYGAKGQVLTDSVMEAFWQAEPAYFKRYSAAQKKAIFDYSRGKIGYDCSGFVGAVTGCMMYSGAQWDKCTARSTNLANGPAGSLLYKPGHVALDIGYGYYLHFPSEMHSCELGRIKENTVPWTGTGMLTGYIDYTGSTNR